MANALVSKTGEPKGFVGSNPTLPAKFCPHSAMNRALRFERKGCRFESYWGYHGRLPEFGNGTVLKTDGAETLRRFKSFTSRHRRQGKRLSHWPHKPGDWVQLPSLLPFSCRLEVGQQFLTLRTAVRIRPREPFPNSIKVVRDILDI